MSKSSHQHILPTFDLLMPDCGQRWSHNEGELALLNSSESIYYRYSSQEVEKSSLPYYDAGIVKVLNVIDAHLENRVQFLLQ